MMKLCIVCEGICMGLLLACPVSLSPLCVSNHVTSATICPKQRTVKSNFVAPSCKPRDTPNRPPNCTFLSTMREKERGGVATDELHTEWCLDAWLRCRDDTHWAFRQRAIHFTNFPKLTLSLSHYIGFHLENDAKASYIPFRKVIWEPKAMK